MHPFQNIIDCYDKTAKIYADKFYQELDHKPLEKELLIDFLNHNNNCNSMIDLGCGPGHIAAYLQKNGAENIVGIDISPEMIRVAQALNPAIKFEVSDILDLKYEAHSFDAALAFYSLIYFTDASIKSAFKAIRRLLKTDGEFLFSFHLGDGMRHFDEFLGHPASIDCNFVDRTEVEKDVMNSGFEIVQIIERAPYPDIEFPSRRAYFWVRASEQLNF